MKKESVLCVRQTAYNGFTWLRLTKAPDGRRTWAEITLYNTGDLKLYIGLISNQWEDLLEWKDQADTTANKQERCLRFAHQTNKSECEFKRKGTGLFPLLFSFFSLHL